MVDGMDGKQALGLDETLVAQGLRAGARHAAELRNEDHGDQKARR